MALLLKNLLFTLVAPGTVAVLVPLFISGCISGCMSGGMSGGADDGLAGAMGRGGSPPAAGALAIALPLLGVGGAIYAWCVWDFATFGRGTPAPIDAPKKLVVRGLYRYSRNPMYLGVLTVILAWAVLFQAASLAAYAVLVATAFHLFILFYEEPHLEHEFGSDYTSYKSEVGRWLPRLPRKSD